MAANPQERPIIVVRRITKGGGGHHGGAWKIAYADFVTAMMAFFLLMWLLGSTTKGDLHGIADYFQTPLKVALSGGSGSGDSSSVIQGGGMDLTRSHGQVKKTDLPDPKKTINLQAARNERGGRDMVKLQELQAKLSAAIQAHPVLSQFQRQIKIDFTEEGLRIQIVDEQNRPMFASGSAVLKDYMREILREIGHVLNGVEHRIAVSGHTDDAPYASGQRGYSNWELSADRANASRRELLAGGMEEAKVLRVLGLAASIPYDAKEPGAPVNRRISIVVLNHAAEEAFTKSGSTLDVTHAEDLVPKQPVPMPPEAPVPAPARR
ncbi:flagellar motor protein MotB [Betaproteobacteria bacterium GR16-43]|nr:flagellar motor protein MotB [Betaproteobacteria bacterium GR16-43]